jgi:hypothetical protein
MWAKVSDATLDWPETNAAARTKASSPFGLRRCLESAILIPATDASQTQWELEDFTQSLRDLDNNWNQLNNTNGIFPVPLIPDTNLLVNYVYPRNRGSRPWLEELCMRRQTKIEFFNDPFTTAPALNTKAETSEFQKPPTVVSRHKEIEWLSSHTSELSKYEGKWIALEGEEIIAWGSDEVEVETQARGKGVKVPFLFRVSSKDDAPFIGCSIHGNSSI